MKQLLSIMLLWGMTLAGSAQASKLCSDAKVHEYLIVPNKLYSGDAKKYFDIMKSLGVGPDKEGAAKVLAGAAIKCQKEEFCVQSVFVYRANPNLPVINLQAFCRPLTKDEERT